MGQGAVRWRRSSVPREVDTARVVLSNAGPGVQMEREGAKGPATWAWRAGGAEPTEVQPAQPRGREDSRDWKGRPTFPRNTDILILCESSRGLIKRWRLMGFTNNILCRPNKYSLLTGCGPGAMCLQPLPSL